MTNEIKKYCEGLDCAICDEKEPCIYKIANDLQEQLKRKEQECEELKTKLLNLLGKEGIRQLEKEFYEQQLDQLKAENEELKRQHQADKGLITSTGKMNYQLIQEYAKYKAESDLLRQTHKTEQDRRRAYENALTEIKEIAEEKANVNDWLALEILQKISEVEDVGN